MSACWAFAAVTLGAVAVAAFIGDLRRAVLALWVAGLGVGAVYLTLGAEVLAVVQWIVSTLVAISFVFFSAMFGEYGAGDPADKSRRALKVVLGVIAGAAFAWVIWVGSGQLSEEALDHVVEGTDTAAVGRSLTGQNLISLEVLAMTLFLVLVGGGVIGRPDGGHEPDSRAQPAPGREEEATP